jgi:hypothetical protein
VPIGQHLANAAGILNAHRVLSSSGQVAEGFHWLDPEDKRDVHEVLSAERVHLDAQRRADPAQRLRAEDLADLIDEVFEPKPMTADEGSYDWRVRRQLRYLRHFYEAEGHSLHEDEARDLAIQEGYDLRGIGGFYQGTPSLRREGEFRVLTESGRQFYERDRYRLD